MSAAGPSSEPAARSMERTERGLAPPASAAAAAAFAAVVAAGGFALAVEFPLARLAAVAALLAFGGSAAAAVEQRLARELDLAAIVDVDDDDLDRVADVDHVGDLVDVALGE